MLDKLYAQLKTFRDEDEARWKYEAEEVKRQNQIFAEHGRTDKQGRAALEKAGIDVRVLKEQSSEAVKQMEKAHKELLTIGPPPARSGRQQPPALLNYLSSFRPDVALTNYRCDWFYPPLQDAWGNGEECGFNLDLGEINIAAHSTGDGWGLAATAYSWRYCTMWYVYFPPAAGDILIEPHVDFQGNVAISAHDHWYTSTVAKLKVNLLFDLYQHYWDGEEKAVIIDEHRTDSSTAYWVDDHRVMSKTLSVSAHDPVLIKLTVAYYVVAHSSHATVDFDFRTGAERRIRLEHIKICRPEPLRAVLSVS
ncbi:MAG TPA: hypothetical protein P5526_29290 [Anaerolineae bacterium]|nr:hypothetical protein [Anaerolineae bacterium]MCB0180452.1 hypothetical protein [Anaerolineae bacterium]MCB0225827.1 hypothetical protein [Anaerolineae bacterium]MCB9109411.1 hypothetical protein [Anaerolineales bacterium]HRV96283.1 hypothetical protein [Anaerolineae bacterium]